ncbi:MAG: site-2 protease family protein [Gammaproteobacteria bacterium]|nr:site-2 protease family protein [Gammaproteobacteria bacterium]MDH5729220.1 site-2 protease family protein [Gammaproteobacteria bacterium]
MNENFIQLLVASVIPVLFAITVHEVAHGWVAKKLGDPTAMMLGRLTLNPIKHIDPIGTIVVPLVLLMLGGGMFGWAKPVPITWENLRHPRRDTALVALAGPVANLLMAIFWVSIMAISVRMGTGLDNVDLFLYRMGEVGVLINLVLMVLNLLPIPPLDGGRVVASSLPGPLAWKYSKIEPYGLIIVLLLFATGYLWPIIQVPMASIQTLLFSISGL